MKRITSGGSSNWVAKLARWFGLQAPARLSKHEISVRRLSQPLRIAFASDFHIGGFTSLGIVEGACELLSEARPDLLLLGGDFVSSSRADIRGLARRLSAVPAALGRFAVLGDHDRRSGANAIRDALESEGIRVLENESVHVRRLEDEICLCGMDDATRSEELRCGPSGRIDIVFTHSPSSLREIERRSFTVAFCGHTHGGQVALPGGRPLYVPGGSICRQFSGGRYDLNGGTDRVVIVSRGVGCTAIPIRLFAPADVIVCDLVPAHINADVASSYE